VPGYGGFVDTAERWRRLPGLERLPAETAAALTFDDGPDPDGTPPILDALDAAGVKGTFFVVGEQLMRHHAVAREARDRGHELALHGFAHVEHDTLSPQQARDDLARALGAFEASLGQRPRFFRPPYGRFSEHSYAACLHLGLEPVYWSAWGMDWEVLAGERIAELVIRDLAGGAIVLLHDSVRYAHRPDTIPTAKALGRIARAAEELDLTLRPLGQLT
jgi:peptidoglycan/xylan/chitin deacetylase (PgdA/CDA1 family)